MDGGNDIALTSGGVTHILRFVKRGEGWALERRAIVPQRQRGECEAKHLARLPFLPYAFLCLLLPEAWRRHARFLRGETAPVSFPPTRLKDGGYLWEIDRNARRVSLLTKDGKPLCRVQLRHAILTGAVWEGNLLIPLENGAGEIVIRIRHI